jgi:hypothetical protein
MPTTSLLTHYSTACPHVLLSFQKHTRKESKKKEKKKDFQSEASEPPSS